MNIERARTFQESAHKLLIGMGVFVLEIHMTETYDQGSLPYPIEFNEKRFLEGSIFYAANLLHDSAQYFEKITTRTFVDKIATGINIPSYPEFRDINQMFLEPIEGVEKIKEGFIQTGPLSLKREKTIIPEVLAIRRNAREINEKIGRSFKIRLGIVGPHTLSSFFNYRYNQIFIELSDILAQIVENNIFAEKYASVSILALEEPLFGLLDDPLISYGSQGRENLLSAWESILGKAKAKGVQTTLHLHKTTDELFWQVESLDTIEAPTDDMIYQLRRTKQQLDTTDKTLMASICTNDFDKLIEEKILKSTQTNALTIGDDIAEAWKDIRSGKLKAETFLESIEEMKNRLVKIVERFGAERVPYASPECGLKGFPTYNCAIECLRRVSKATESVR